MEPKKLTLPEQFEQDVCSKCEKRYCEKKDFYNHIQKNQLQLKICYSEYLEEKLKVLKLNQCDFVDCDLLSESIIETRNKNKQFLELKEKIKQEDHKGSQRLKNIEKAIIELKKENEELKEKSKGVENKLKIRIGEYALIAHEISKIVHDNCKDVPHDIGIIIFNKIHGNLKEATNEKN